MTPFGKKVCTAPPSPAPRRFFRAAPFLGFWVFRGFARPLFGLRPKRWQKSPFLEHFVLEEFWFKNDRLCSVIFSAGFAGKISLREIFEVTANLCAWGFAPGPGGLRPPGCLSHFWPFGPKGAFGSLPPSAVKQAPSAPSGLRRASRADFIDWEGLGTPVSHPIFGGFWVMVVFGPFFHRGRRF